LLLKQPVGQCLSLFAA